MKHAYMIMAHSQEWLLIKLIEMLDDIDNDIYIHLDKKSDISGDHLCASAKKSKVILTERINVEWGGYSQIEATLILLKEALKSQHIYYHMLAGVDLPIKNIQEINEFYNKNTGRQFIRFFDEKKATVEYNKRYGFKNIFRDKFGKKNSIWKVLNKIAFVMQKTLNIRDDSLENRFFLGASSWDITEDLAKDVVAEEKNIKKTYKWTSCCDEVFLQTFIYNTKYWKQLWVPYSKDGNGMKANMRFIDFSDEYRGSPHTVQIDDIKMLMQSKLNFARKFDMKYKDAVAELEKELGKSGGRKTR